METTKITIETPGEETRVMEVRGLLASAVSGDKKQEGDVETSQVFVGMGISEYELFTILSTNIRSIYKILGNDKKATHFIKMAAKAAKDGHREEMKSQ